MAPKCRAVVSIQLPDDMPQGAGKRLFADSGPAIKLAFAGSETCSNGALHPHLPTRRTGRPGMAV
jgi:hypothetical protein